MHYLKSLAVCFSMLCLAPTANAEWVESTGQAIIFEGNREAARAQAIESALTQALIFSGASISSIQTLTDGLLTKDQVKLSSHGEVNSLAVIEESSTNNQLSIKIRADIFPSLDTCYTADFKKTLAVTRFNLQHREQATLGAIYDIDKAFSNRVYQALKKQSDSLAARPWFKRRINLADRADEYFTIDQSSLDAITQQSESTYVLLGNIIDVSTGETDEHVVQFWKDDKTERFFAVEIILVNGLSGEIIYRDNFGQSSHWTFPVNDEISVNSARFWRSDYGNAIQQVITAISNNINEQLRCEPLQGRITKVSDHGVYFNLGMQHGINKGQKFRLSYQSEYFTPDNKRKQMLVIAPFTVTVEQLTQQTSFATVPNNTLLGNIQTADIVTLHEVKE